MENTGILLHYLIYLIRGSCISEGGGKLLNLSCDPVFLFTTFSSFETW